MNWLVLAMAHCRLGHSDEAGQCLETAKTIIDAARPKNPDEPVELEPCDWIPDTGAFREAKQLLEGNEARPISNEHKSLPDAKTSAADQSASSLNHEPLKQKSR